MKIKLVKVAKVLSGITLGIIAFVVALTVFWVGYSRGFILGKNEQLAQDQKYLSQIADNIYAGRV